SAVLEYRPGSGRVTLIARLPVATTHPAAAAVGPFVYLIGGRGAVVGSATGRIVAIDVRTNQVHKAGSLLTPPSDLAAVAGGPPAAGSPGGAAPAARSPASGSSSLPPRGAPWLQGGRGRPPRPQASMRTTRSGCSVGPPGSRNPSSTFRTAKATPST